MKTVKELRVERSLSQRELAQLLGTHQPRVSFWENRCYKLQPIHLYKLAQFFGVRIHDIIVGRPEDRRTGAQVDHSTPVAVQQARWSENSEVE